MNCEELRARLDAYMDGELSVAEFNMMKAHAATCEDCRREMEAARLVRDALGEMGGEVPVPLEAQASWRRAVRAEAAKNGFTRVAAKRGHGRWLRAACAAAAALALALGAAAMLDRTPGAREDRPMTVSIEPGDEAALPLAAALPTEAVVASDGSAEAAAQALDEAAALPQGETYAAWRKYGAEDFDAACATVEALAEEYSGSFGADYGDSDAAARGAVYRVELPSEYLDDFLSAVSHVGEELDSEALEAAGDTAVVYIQIDERGAGD